MITMPTGAQMIIYIRIGNLKHYVLCRGTYRYGPYIGVPYPTPPPQEGVSPLHLESILYTRVVVALVWQTMERAQ